MATAVLTNLDLECSICMEDFKLPKVLSCGHSFCRDCLERCIDGRNVSFPCPFCKQDIAIPQGGADKFPTNFSLKTLTDSTSHKPKNYCPNHSKKEVEYYCQTCNLGLCFRCIFNEHNDHKTLDLELDSNRENVIKKLSEHEQFLRNKIEDLRKDLATLVETSEILKSFCDEACNKISKETEKIIGELKENCLKIQQKIRNHFDKNESKMAKTQKQVMTQIENIETDLDASHPATEKPTLTLIYSLTKLQELQKLCENMTTDIPPVTYVEWREGDVKVGDILGSTVTKPLYQSSESSVFKFNYNDIKSKDVNYYSKDKSKSHGMVWRCKAVRSTRCLNIDIKLLEEDNPGVESCRIKYTLTLLNKDKEKNVRKTTTDKFTPGGYYMEDNITTCILLNKLTDPPEGFIDKESQFLVRFDIQVLNIECKKCRYDV